MLFGPLFSPVRLPPAFEFTLDHGTRALVRPIRPEDAPRLQEGFRRLSQLARRRRFLDEVSELSEEQLRQLTHLDQVNQVAWGALNLDKADEPGIGVARYHRLDEEHDAADVAITIADEYQGHGAGTLLHACLHATAHRNGIRCFYYDVHGDNDRFIRQLKELGAEHVGRVVNVTRMKLAVFSRAGRVPVHSEAGRRMRAIMKRLARAKAVDA
jgi:RimJ/RimL family protein N-acetyltransferase